MIELNEFEFPAKDYLRMFRQQRGIVLCWIWGYGSVFLYSVAIVTENWIETSCSVAMIALFIFLANYVFSRYYVYVLSKNNPTFQKRKLSFDDQKYYVLAEDGLEGSVPLKHFTYTDSWNGYYRLFMNNFVYVPISKSAFRSEEDRLRFETEILAPRLKKKTYWKRYVIFLIVSAILLGTGFAIRATMSSNEYDYIETNYIEE